ncbi:thioesterase family protein [Nocardioides sp. J54]|uniref:thioesterase family protein n=1 Tax=Nocardioides sp. J54 TaxID=935866 RepID=UPI0004B7B5FA|nr:thioesterase family protein [Nocardioides sp. J54]
MSNADLPSYHQVLDLPVLHEGDVTPDFIDANGHMNIRHYLDAGAFAADVLLRRIGVDDAYRASRRRGVFTAEHHIRYFTEMHAGGRFSAHTAFVARSAKAGHLLSFILDREHERLSCTVEIIVVAVDLETRRPADFPDDIAGRIDEHVAEATRLAWPLPLSGAMGIRSRA